MRNQLLIVMAAAIGLGGVALAQRPGPGPEQGPPPRRRPPRGMLKQELGLTDAQVSQLRKLHTDERETAILRRANMAVARMDLNDLLGAATLDEKAVSARVKELNDLQAAALQARVNARLGLRKVLTPEQLEKMKELGPGLEMGPHGRGWGRGPGRGPMPPPGGGGRGDEPEDGDEPIEAPPSR